MPNALVLIADGTEETEFVTVYDLLVRAGFNVHSTGIGLKKSSEATCSRNVRIIPDSSSLSSIPPSFQPHSGDVIVLPGGATGAKTFSSDKEVLKLIRDFRNADARVAAICAATTALVASVEDGKGESGEGVRKARVTSHPSVKKAIVEAGWDYADEKERVVVDGKVITSRGPGTAILFALTIVEEICGKDKMEEVKGPLICADTL